MSKCNAVNDFFENHGSEGRRQEKKDQRPSVNLLKLLILGVHESQGYSSWVCVFVCPVRFFHTVTNRPRRPTGHLSAAID